MKKSLFLFLAMTAAMTVSAASGQFRQVLTSVDQNIRLDAWEIDQRDLGGSEAQPWSVRKRTLHGGKQEGVDVIEVNNGKQSFTVIPTRGMGILEVRQGDIRLGWDSPVKQVVHPSLVNLHSRGGLGWLDGFNEWMCRCGLESAGHPGTDSFIDNTGAEAEMDLTLHGKIANIPASEVEVLIDREEPHRIRIRGRVDERMFYGPKLELWTEISTTPGSSEFQISDTIQNHGAFPQEFQIIYHANFAAPILGKDASFIAPVKEVTPFNEHAAKSISAYDKYVGPTKGFTEEVYCFTLNADRAGNTAAMLRNADGDKAVSMSWPVEQLPYFTLWKNTAAMADGYVTGLEPATGFPYNRGVERKAGRVPQLQPGQQRTFTIDFSIHASKAEVRQAESKISRIQGARKAKVNESAPKLD